MPGNWTAYTSSEVDLAQDQQRIRELTHTRARIKGSPLFVESKAQRGQGLVAIGQVAPDDCRLLRTQFFEPAHIVAEDGNVVDAPEDLLHLFRFSQETVSGPAQERLKKLQGVAQLFEFHAQGMQDRVVGSGQHRVVGSDARQSLVQEYRQHVTQLMRLFELGKGPGSPARLFAEPRELPQKSRIELRIEKRIESRAVFAAAAVQPVDHLIERRLVARWQGGAKCLQIFNQDIEIADAAEGAGDAPQIAAVLVDGLGLVGSANEQEEAAHAPDGDPHLVDRFDVLARAAARFVAFHPSELRSQQFATGFRHGIMQ